MTALATFLRQEKAAIVRAFNAHRPTLRGEALLDAITDALEHRPPAFDELLVGAEKDRTDLDQIIAELTIFRDAIYDCLEARAVSPAVREIRVLGDILALVMKDAGHRLARGRDTIVERQRRELLELFHQSPGFLGYVRGRDLVYELENEAYAQIIGNRDIHGKPMREALPELAGQGFFEMLEGVLDTGEPVVGRGMRADLQRTPGAPLETVLVDLIFQPIRDVDGHVQGVLMQGNDVTAVRREEAARLRAEERFRNLVQAMDDGYSLIEMIEDASGTLVDYRFLEVNAAFEKQTGLVDVVGKTAREALPALDPVWFARYGEVARTGVQLRRESYVDGLDRWYEIQANRVGDPTQKLVAIVFNDITSRIAASTEREKLLALESAARKEAEMVNKLRDDFLATVSHELRTPLNAMLGWVQLMRSGALNADKTRHALETIERNARVQTQLIDDLLDVSRILAGKLRLEREPVDLKLVVEAACDAIQPAALAKNVRLECSVEPGLVTLGDPHRLQQIVGNLLSNALKFTPKEGAIRLRATTANEGVRVEVSDTGVGIAADFLPHVFERFRQASTSTTRTHGGLGLGLAIVRQLVELHGGKVSASSPGLGQGATFVVELPREAGELAERVTSPRLGGARDLTDLDVLIVEDEPDARDMLRAMIELMGGKPRTAASAAEAMASFEAKAPDLLLSDIAMPEEDGYALITKVRARPKDRGGAVPAVAITAFGRSEDRSRALRAGFDDHLTKPVDAAELTSTLEDLLARGT